MPNIFEPEFDQQREHPGFRALRARLGWQLATERLGASIWEIEPGEAAYPYHYHLAEEELVIVLMGRPSVRTNGGDWRELEAGEVLSFPLGADGGHQARELGRGHRPLPRALDPAAPPTSSSTPTRASSEPASACPDRNGLWEFFRLADAVDYHDGERPPTPPR